MNKQEQETLALLQELEDALNTKGEVTKELKLQTWSKKMDKRQNIWDKLASR